MYLQIYWSLDKLDATSARLLVVYITVKISKISLIPCIQTMGKDETVKSGKNTVPFVMD